MARVLEKASALLGRQRAHRRLDVVRQVVFIDLPELRRRCALMTFMAYSMIPRTSELSGGLYVTPCPYARMHLLTSSVLCALALSMTSLRDVPSMHGIRPPVRNAKNISPEVPLSLFAKLISAISENSGDRRVDLENFRKTLKSFQDSYEQLQ